MSGWVLAASAVVAPEGVLAPGWVAVVGDRIDAVGAGRPPAVAVTDLGDGVLLPGFVDMHVHGGGGAWFSGGLDDARRAARFHRSHGTTTLLASLVSESPDVLAGQVAVLAEAVDEGTVAGIHLEGPWLSAERCGAHDPAVLRLPEPAELDALLRAGRGGVRMVTLAPELPGALDAVRRLVGAGVRVAVGHTAADYDTVRAAQRLGADVATHLFNAMPGIHHRRPGPVVALLDDPGTVVELICDGAHVHPAVVSLAVARAGADRVALVSDAIAAAGRADGRHRMGRVDVTVRDGVARATATGALAGSTLTVDAAVRMVAGLGFPLAEVSRMASAVPARVLGLSGDRGVVAPGLRADLAVLGPDLRVRRVMASGGWVDGSAGASA